MFGIMIELYPRDLNGPRRLALHNEIFETESEANNKINEFRRQNLPLKGKWIISFEDPRT